jgi:hypothetical protein
VRARGRYRMAERPAGAVAPRAPGPTPPDALLVGCPAKKPDSEKPAARGGHEGQSPRPVAVVRSRPTRAGAAQDAHRLRHSRGEFLDGQSRTDAAICCGPLRAGGSSSWRTDRGALASGPAATTRTFAIAAHES